jgi:hypothetical protein
MKSKVLLPSDYGLPGGRSGFVAGAGDLDVYEDLASQFPIVHLDEVSGAGRLTGEVGEGTMGVVVSRDFSVTGGFHVMAPDLRYYSSAAADALHSGLAAALGTLRPGERLQFNWMVSDMLDPVFGDYVRARPGDPPFVTYFRNRRLARVRQGFKDGSLRHFSSSVFVCLPFAGRVVDVSPRGFGENVMSFFHTFLHMAAVNRGRVEAEDMLRNFGLLQDRVALLGKTFGAVRGLFVSPVHSPDYMRMWRQLLSPGLWARLRGAPLEEQGRFTLEGMVGGVAAQCATERVVDSGSYFTTGRFYHRILSVEIPPTMVEMGYLMGVLTRADVLGAIRNFQVSLVVEPRSREREVAVLRRRRRIVDNQCRRNPTETLRMQVQQLDFEIAALENNEVTQLVSAVLVVHLWSDSLQDLSFAEELIVSKLRVLATLVMAGEELNALPYFLSYCLPGCPGRGDVYRQLPMTNFEVAPLVPLMGQGTGVVRRESPEVPAMFTTDFGVPFGLDLFARGAVSAFNGVVVGGAGSGKSFLVNHLIASYCNRRAKVIIVDAAVGSPSFKSMCSLLGGVYIDKSFCMNVLGTRVDKGVVMSPDEEEMTVIVSRLEAILTSESERLLPEQRAFLMEAVNYLFDNRPSEDGPYLRHLPQALMNCVAAKPSHSKFRDLAETWCTILKSVWTYPQGANANARYVDGHDDFPRSWLTVFDLKWVLDRRDLLTVLMASVLGYLKQLVAENMRRQDGERDRILFIIDEGWKVLFDPAFSDMVLGMYKASRSRNAGTFMLTQDFSDFISFLTRMMKSSGEVKTSPVITQSSHFFVGNIDVQEARLIGDTLGLVDTQVSSLSSLKREDGKFSEYGYFCRVVNHAEMLFSRIRYAPLPEEFWAFTSNAEDDARRSARMREVELELASGPAARERFIAGLVEAGWPEEGLRRLSHSEFVMAVVVASVSRPSSGPSFPAKPLAAG